MTDRITERPTRTLTISKSFSTTPTPTERTALIADAFGVGIDNERKNIVYDETPIVLARGDVIYISGESGGGKSVLLRELRDIFARTDRVADAAMIEFKRGVPLVEAPEFRDLDHATGTLAQVGLGDAFLYLSEYDNLSDGQKFRARLALLLASDADVWVCDEFTSALDRETAQIVAYTFQRQARRLGKTLIVATAHDDLTTALAPDVLVVKNYGPSASLSYHTTEPKLTVWDRLEFQSVDGKGGLKRYYDSDLAHFHYRAHSVPGVREMIFAHDPLYGRDVGVIIGTTPQFENANRSALTNRVFVKQYAATNANIILISRVVVLPKYRSIGLGQYLVRRFLAQTAYPFVETLAEMAKSNPFFERAGMTAMKDVGGPNDDRFKLRDELVSLGVNRSLIRSRRYLHDWLTAQLPEWRDDFMRRSYVAVNSQHHLSGSKARRARPDFVASKENWVNAGLETQSRELAAVFRPRPAYLYWMRPGWDPAAAAEEISRGGNTIGRTDVENDNV